MRVGGRRRSRRGVPFAPGVRRRQRGAAALVLVALVSIVAGGAVASLYVLTATRSRAARDRLALLRTVAAAESLVGWQLQAAQDAEANGQQAPPLVKTTWGALDMERYQGEGEAGDVFSVTARASFDGVRRGLVASFHEPIHELFRKSLYSGNRTGGTNHLRFGPDLLMSTRRFGADASAPFGDFFHDQTAHRPDSTYVTKTAALGSDVAIHRNLVGGIYPYAYHDVKTSGGVASHAAAGVAPFQAVIDALGAGTARVVYQVANGFEYGSSGFGTRTEKTNEDFLSTWNRSTGPNPDKRYIYDFMPHESRVYVWDVERYQTSSSSFSNEGGSSSSPPGIGSRRGPNLLAVYEYPDGLLAGADQALVVENADLVAGSVHVNRGEGQTSDVLTVGKADDRTNPYRDPALLRAYDFEDVLPDGPLTLPADVAAEGAIAAARLTAFGYQRLGPATEADLSRDSSATIAPDRAPISPPDLSAIDYEALADVVVTPPAKGHAMIADGAFNDAIQVQSRVGGVTATEVFVKPTSFMADPAADVPRFVIDDDGDYDPSLHSNYFFVLGSLETALTRPSSSAESTLMWDRIPSDMRLAGTNYNRMTVPAALDQKLIFVDGNLVVEPDGARMIMDSAAAGGAAQVTIVVRGNIYLADAVMAAHDQVALVMIAMADGASYEDRNQNGRRDDGEPAIGEGASPLEGSGNIFFGDTNANDPIGMSTAYLYAENDFHMLAPSDPAKQQTFGVLGNMTAGNKIHFDDRGRSNLVVVNDVRLARGLIEPKGLPRSFRLTVASWTWLAQQSP
jgi:hypothetical protein